MTFLCPVFRKPAEERDIKRELDEKLLSNLDRSTTRVATAMLHGRTNGTTGILQHQMHNNSLAHENCIDLIPIRMAVILEERKSHA